MPHGWNRTDELSSIHLQNTTKKDRDKRILELERENLQLKEEIQRLKEKSVIEDVSEDTNQLCCSQETNGKLNGIVLSQTSS